ncbi:MAG: (d)CMP kinase [Flavobacteriales bacterium]|nr:(d)CMP kinase [Flavobacteriales bacterium]MBQ2421554.1 (d)CMP kinase [Flavobacteriales bacterium]
MDKPIIIAIDGVSGSGKSTMARTLAAKYNFMYVDTGAMYRAVTYYAIEKKYLTGETLLKSQLIDDLNKIDICFDENGHTLLNGVDVEDKIRGIEVSQGVSKIATIAEVRNAMVDQQRKMSHSHSVVMDGRDIGTTVFPNADIKLYVTSSPEVRARRRHAELMAKGEVVDYDTILKNITERDYIDSSREVSPLVKAADAIEIDNSSMSIDEQNALINSIIEKLLS